MRIGVLALVGGLAAALPAVALSAAAKPPVVVELYTSQGCATCAEAGSLIDELAARKAILPLTFSVDYWDYLGWTDTFARPEFSARQRSCTAHRRFSGAIYTPQVLIAGRGDARADETEIVERMIRRAEASEAAGPAVSLERGKVRIAAGAAVNPAADVWLIRYDPRMRDVEVKRGENQGRTIAYRNVVRQLVRLGGWSGKAVTYALPAAPRDGLSTLVIVQKPACGEVIAAAL